MKKLWIFLAAFGFQTSIMLRGASNTLENDQMCGITTGGKEECNWDCESSFCLLLPNLILPIYTDAECLRNGINEHKMLLLLSVAMAF